MGRFHPNTGLASALLHPKVLRASTGRQVEDKLVAFRVGRGGAAMAGAVLLAGFGPMDGHLEAGLLLGLLTLASLLLHECGHLLAARASGVKIREIGFCLRGSYIRREPARMPLDDAAIALSGPLVNALIAAALWTVPGVGHWLAIYNLVLVASNLVPLPGSDGRRAFTAWTQNPANARGPLPEPAPLMSDTPAPASQPRC
ncbi:MAG: site-2 protease family protein [Acidobacteriaceae bacterium]